MMDQVETSGKATSRRQFASISRGFTLIEVVLVFMVLMVLVAILLPAIQNTRETARATECRNKLTQIGIALQHYSSVHRMFPPGCVNNTRPIVSEPKGYHVSWALLVLPFLEQQTIYDHWDFAAGVYDARNAKPRKLVLPIFHCDSAVWGGSDEAGPSHYAGCHHDTEAPIDVDQNGMLFLNSSVTWDDIRDGAANTILVGECRTFNPNLGWASGTRSTLRNTGTLLNEVEYDRLNTEFGEWVEEKTNSKDTSVVSGFGSAHRYGRTHFLFADGAVRAFQKKIDQSLLQLLANRRDGKLVPDF